MHKSLIYRYSSLDAQLPEYAGCFFYLLHLIYCYRIVNFFIFFFLCELY